MSYKDGNHQKPAADRHHFKTDRRKRNMSEAILMIANAGIIVALVAAFGTATVKIIKG